MKRHNFINENQQNKIYKSVDKLITQYNSLKYDKNVNKKKISAERQIKQILYQIGLIQLDLSLFVYLKNQCPLFKLVRDDVLLNQRKYYKTGSDQDLEAKNIAESKS